MTRTEHMDWCKYRANQYIKDGDLVNAFASMTSDLSKHPDTKSHIGIKLGLMQMMGGMLNTPEKMHHFIEGFN